MPRSDSAEIRYVGMWRCAKLGVCQWPVLPEKGDSRMWGGQAPESGTLARSPLPALPAQLGSPGPAQAHWLALPLRFSTVAPQHSPLGRGHCLSPSLLQIWKPAGDGKAFPGADSLGLPWCWDTSCSPCPCPLVLCLGPETDAQRRNGGRGCSEGRASSFLTPELLEHGVSPLLALGLRAGHQQGARATDLGPIISCPFPSSSISSVRWNQLSALPGSDIV